MNEPFLPLPLPAPPEEGYGRILAGVARYLAARLGRRSHPADDRRPEPRLAPRASGRGAGGGPAPFPTLPPMEF